MGLVIDILNYHAAQLKIGTTSNEIFRVDIDDIKINAHKNMISTNGKVLLIPNNVAKSGFLCILNNRGWLNETKASDN